MQIKILGSGGAFDTDKTNSSFLIDDKILFDCGYNVFPYLRKNNIDVYKVFISHTHFDHIGSLETLVYYNFYVKGKKTIIASGPEVIRELTDMLASHFKNLRFTNGEEGVQWHLITGSTIRGDHGIYPNYGLVIDNVIITGDTRACENIRNKIIELLNQYEKVIVFHDYSDWDNPENIHCYPSNFKEYYDDLIKKYKDRLKFYFYHNGKNEGLILNI